MKTNITKLVQLATEHQSNPEINGILNWAREVCKGLMTTHDRVHVDYEADIKLRIDRIYQLIK